jgi:hypothetical protein
MFSFIGKHPILSLALMLAAHPAAVFLVLLIFMLTHWPGGSEIFIEWLWRLGGIITPAIAGFVVALLRRRGGRPVRRFLLVAPGLVFLWYELMVLAMSFLHVQYETRQGMAVERWFYEAFSDVVRINLKEGEFQVVLLLGLVGTVVGVLLGGALARRLIRTGRWETITPVDLGGPKVDSQTSAEGRP